MISEKRFEDLPLELQEEIFEYVPESAKKVSLVSRGFKEAGSRAYVLGPCSALPTDREVREYLNHYPTIVGVFNLDNDNFTIYTRSTDNSYLITGFSVSVLGKKISKGEQDWVNILLENYSGELYTPEFRPHIIDTEDTHFDDYFREDPMSDILFNLKAKYKYTQYLDYLTNGIADNLSRYLIEPQLDLLSIYRIFQKRVPCLTRDPDFAKKFVLHRLDSIWEAYQNDPNIIALIATYAYLYFQASVLNLYPSPKIFTIDDHGFYMFITLDGRVIDYHVNEEFILINKIKERDQQVQHDINEMKKEIEPLYLRVRNAFKNMKN